MFRNFVILLFSLFLQTYERACIKKWLDAGHGTCPKTRQILSSPILIPNHVLYSLISNWCEANGLEPPKRLGILRLCRLIWINRSWYPNEQTYFQWHWGSAVRSRWALYQTHFFTSSLTNTHALGVKAKEPIQSCARQFASYIWFQTNFNTVRGHIMFTFFPKISGTICGWESFFHPV